MLSLNGTAAVWCHALRDRRHGGYVAQVRCEVETPAGVIQRQRIVSGPVPTRERAIALADRERAKVEAAGVWR